MTQLSDCLNRLAPSATLAMSQKSSEMKAAGIDVINMSVGEPDFNTPEHIKEAAKEAVDENFSRYSPVPGYMDLRKAVSDKLRRENGLDYSTSEILVSNGAKQSVCNTVMALVNPGDEVIIPAPYWVSYPQMVKLAGGVPVIVNAGFDQNFKMTAQQLEEAITPRTRLLILCSPSNPTGSVYGKDELEALANVIKSHDGLFVLADEIYEHINYVGHHESIAQFEGMKERAIIVNGVSKAYAMTGWRIGYTASNTAIAKAMSNYQSHATSNPNSIAQAASIAALEGDQEEQRRMVNEFSRRRQYMMQRISGINGITAVTPKGAFYVFANISGLLGKKYGDRTITCAMDFADLLLENGNTAVVPGEAFGDPHYIRLAYATDMQSIIKGMDRIERFVGQLTD